VVAITASTEGTQFMKTRHVKERHLLVTMTNEPFQPAGLYYSVTDQALVIRKLNEQGMRAGGGHQGP
jgi:hypothetical protein